eukprot:1389567-Amorphochlora_amoeboformis.AAC.2
MLRVEALVALGGCRPIVLGIQRTHTPSPCWSWKESSILNKNHFLEPSPPLFEEILLDRRDFLKNSHVNLEGCDCAKPSARVRPSTDVLQWMPQIPAEDLSFSGLPQDTCER